jgi:hypothetical protein
MSNVIDIKCNHCQQTNTRKYSWIDPKTFKVPKEAFLTSSFFCAYCSKGIAVKIQYLLDNKIKFIKEIDYKSLINEENIPFYIDAHPSEEDESSKEILTEDDAFSLLNDSDE